MKWVASLDGFHLTRGHYSNNSSATIHDYYGGGVAWFTHRTKKGPGHNWVGTSGGAESDMFDEVLRQLTLSSKKLSQTKIRLQMPSFAGTFQRGQ